MFPCVAYTAANQKLSNGAIKNAETENAVGADFFPLFAHDLE